MNEKNCLKPTPVHLNPFLSIMNEFSRILDIKKLGTLPATLTFTAQEKEKESLAKRLNLVALKNLHIQCQVQGTHGEYPLQISAMIKAEVIQSCVMTLKDLPDAVDEPVKLALFPVHTDMAALPESFDETQPEPILLSKDGTVEVGEIFVQYLSLALDPYPKFEEEDC